MTQDIVTSRLLFTVVAYIVAIDIQALLYEEKSLMAGGYIAM